MLIFIRSRANWHIWTSCNCISRNLLLLKKVPCCQASTMVKSRPWCSSKKWKKCRTQKDCQSEPLARVAAPQEGTTKPTHLLKTARIYQTWTFLAVTSNKAWWKKELQPPWTLEEKRENSLIDQSLLLARICNSTKNYDVE